MKIISNFRDYYDHVAFRYGGGDPKIVYLRPYIDNKGDKIEQIFDRQLIRKGQKINSSIINNKYTDIIDIIDSIQRIYYHWGSPEPVEAEVAGLVIGNIFFLLMKRHWNKADTMFHIINNDDLTEIEEKFDKKIYWRKPDTKCLVNHTDDSLIEMCKFVGKPVFIFRLLPQKRCEYVKFYKECPRLGELGIGKYITDEKMYQHLSYFVGNLIKPSPDMMPEPIVTDKDKIIEHGFDYKTSFRNVK